MFKNIKIYNFKEKKKIVRFITFFLGVYYFFLNLTIVIEIAMYVLVL